MRGRLAHPIHLRTVLITTKGLKYEGGLAMWGHSSIGLGHVLCFGTEDRPGPHTVKASPAEHPFMLFAFHDVKFIFSYRADFIARAEAEYHWEHPLSHLVPRAEWISQMLHARDNPRESEVGTQTDTPVVEVDHHPDEVRGSLRKYLTLGVTVLGKVEVMVETTEVLNLHNTVRHVLTSEDYFPQNAEARRTEETATAE